MEGEINNCNPSPKIDKDFLVAALGSDTEIISFEVSPGSKPGDNYSSVLYSIDVEIRNKEGSVETKNLLLKCFPSHPARQEVTARTNFFYRELQAYQTWLPELNRFQKEILGLSQPFKLPFTHVVAGRAEDFSGLKAHELKELKINNLQNFIMMEDLRKSLGYVMPNRKEPLDIYQMRLVAPALAKTHALGWAYKQKVTADIPLKYPFFCVSDVDDSVTDWVDLAESNMDKELNAIEQFFGAESEITKGARNFKQYMKPLMAIFWGQNVEELCCSIMRVKTSKELPKPWTSIIHGDCWSNNILFRYDPATKLPTDVTLVDLQFLYDGCIAIDLLQIIYCGTTTEFRKNHLEDLLLLYADTFSQVCASCDCPVPPGFNFESFKERFHRGKVLGLLCGLMTYPIILQTDESTLDMETMDESKDFGEMLLNAAGGTNIMNPLATERVLQLVEEMYQDGII